MKIYLITRIGIIDYDEYDAKVVRAENPESARKVAATANGDEGASAWLDPANSSVIEVTPHGEEQIILGSFCAG